MLSLWTEELNVKDIYIYKEMIPVYCGKCLQRKAFHNWVEKFSQGRSKVADDARPVAQLAVTTVIRLLCCEFRSTGKAMSKCINVGGGYDEK
jgi:hypothetical protein